jgi:voltage-gated potassium channel
MLLSWRTRVDRALHHPLVEGILLVLIAASVAGTIAEVLVPAPMSRWLVYADDALALVFAIELSLRFLVAKKKIRFFERYWVDILAVIPLWFLRVLRVLRIFRAVILLQRRLSPFRGRLAVRNELAATVLGCATLALLSALVLQRSEGAEFADLEHSLWFSLFSLVGGEPIGGNPTSHVGRWTTLVLMMGGMTVFGVFVATVSAGMVARLTSQLEIHELDIDELVGHIVVCGWNGSAVTLLRELLVAEQGAPVVLVTEVPAPEIDLRLLGAHRDRLYLHVGDYTRLDVLETLAIRQASRVVLLADGLVSRSDQDCDARTVLAALTIERMARGIYTVAELHNQDNEALLKLAGVEDVVVADVYAGLILGTVQRNRGIVRVFDDILTVRHGSSFDTIEVPPELVGSPVTTVLHMLHLRQHMLLLAVEQGGQTRVNPPPEMVVEAGARLVVLKR